MNDNIFALYGNIAFTPEPNRFEIHPDSFLICKNGKVLGIYCSLPEKYLYIRVLNYKDSLIIPGLCDTHLHAPQYAFRGLGMDLELIDWLNNIPSPKKCSMKIFHTPKKHILNLQTL